MLYGFRQVRSGMSPEGVSLQNETNEINVKLGFADRVSVPE
jgi:hypothetical protein